jgi:hypothetical protein
MKGAIFWFATAAMAGPNMVPHPYEFEPSLQLETYNSSQTGREREKLILPKLKHLGLVERAGDALIVTSGGKELARFEDSGTLTSRQEFSFVDISTPSRSLLFVTAWYEGGGHILLNYGSGTSIKPSAAPVWAPSKMRFVDANAHAPYQHFVSAKAEIWEAREDKYILAHSFDLKSFGELSSVDAKWISEKRLNLTLTELISMQRRAALMHDPKWDKKMPTPKKIKLECVEVKKAWKCSAPYRGKRGP